MAFHYTPVATGNFRLLKLAAPYHGRKHERLSFSMAEYHISQAPSYTAVSHVWGSGTATKEILVNSHPLPVRPNLWTCLHYLAQYRNLNLEAWTHMWVDFICIDQSNVDERTRQVRSMDRIFARANEVSAWLGNQNDPRYLFLREEAVMTLEIDDYIPYDHVPELANRPFWSRMWIVQEIVLAKHVRLHIGNTSIDFSSFSSQLEDYEGAHKKDLERILAYVKARSLDVREVSYPLLELLLDFGSCQCQDPKDKVFALLGMIPGHERRILDRFLPDYSLTHDAVVVLTLSLLRELSDQDIDTKKDMLFDALGVSSSKSARRRLWQASDHGALERIQELLDRNPLDQVPAFLEIHGYNYLDDVVQYSTSQGRPSTISSLVTLPFRAPWTMMTYLFQWSTERRRTPGISRAEDGSLLIPGAWARQLLREAREERKRSTRSPYGTWES
ncbi:hypothetical protein M409DRAFT_20698 [Zasmidium cellare ATCC 36951]|uniref:Heterokaryon incompatibility domain-containing protein n=1 Tax=Zasmidium cellare ATCC 36951 TaxID=1080233 RepID=A0A6A6CQP6_ZASCE|nr:uncharacterized protein M409DRAFT_20698 [Zasmidium cellare ATCC 36951]KAF2169484.1 hypothetical protein M409DRAFT_20698 [Zasmidium cellare ATCC 36951]